MTTELLDIFDKDMNHLGTASRQEAHAQGLWHQTFHCWILNPSAERGPSLLLQLRHRNKDTFPGMFDTSCAGHIMAGETIQDGVRELEEELGLSADISELIYCGRVAEEYVLSEQLIDREFNHIFVYECDKPVEEYDFQLSEISGLFMVGLQDFEQLLNGVRKSISAVGVLHDELEEMTNPAAREISREDIALNSLEYFELLFNTIHERILSE
ncbi:NUDIX domain-containing protein [Paenibacillus zeisoli]|uniref:NUDIX domain-containing protein n=1 Tax=Paenibacillus zeisoli TaxID=2496267 RepID=A0A3S1B602_9BACL|nr:NUDIX domain-containing protein [Paenibacillus zeisoli]RUT28018.1 NUDIX domain-containing protein [Paenibacillus zeisoli]